MKGEYISIETLRIWQEVEKENEELRTKINKAIEYIKYNATSNYFDETANMFRREMDLLDILGDSNE